LLQEVIKIKQIYQENVENVNKLEKRSFSILDELEKKAVSVSTSDYAEIFQNQSHQYKKSSRKWALSGVIIFIFFLILVFKFHVFDNLPTETLVDGHVMYHVSNIILKITSIALIVFFISFSIRQFSINRHLCTINKHRQNALNSYKLFIETISPNDTVNRHNLMLQLAKAIYDQTNTGYISDKGNNVNGSIVEITKLMRGVDTE
jgi:hypothetical protein